MGRIIYVMAGVAVLIALASVPGLIPTGTTPTLPDGMRRCHPEGIMGTCCMIMARSENDDPLMAAEQELRRLEALLSVHIDRSEICKFNAAPAMHPITLHPDARAVIDCARQAFYDTDGAFDMACLPLIHLWTKAAATGLLPQEQAILTTMEGSETGFINRHDDDAFMKCHATVRIDLGGVAKGWAIDRACAVMRDLGVAAGMVEVGGDLKVFGPGDRDDGSWTVSIASPNGVDGDRCAIVALQDRAICTSGNYFRYSVITGQRYSHIIDPRTGWPADAVPAVSVIAPNAATADIWATALSVLGEDGLELLPPDVDAVLLMGIDQEAKVVRSPGFARWEVEVVTLPHLDK